MKKILSIILLSLISIPLLGQSFSATETPYGTDMNWSYYISAADSNSGISGTIIELNKYDANLASYPLGYYLNIDTLSASGEIIAIYMQGKMSNGGWVNVDTILAADTLNSNHSGYVNVKGVLNLNASSYVFPMYRPNIVMSGADGNTCSVRLELYAYKED